MMEFGKASKIIIIIIIIIKRQWTYEKYLKTKINFYNGKIITNFTTIKYEKKIINVCAYQ